MVFLDGKKGKGLLLYILIPVFCSKTEGLVGCVVQNERVDNEPGIIQTACRDAGY